MGVRFWAIVCSILALFLAARPDAMAQSPLALPGAGASSAQPSSAAPVEAAASAPARQVNIAAIAKKASGATGSDLDAKLKSWRADLDRIDQGLHDPKLEYKDLNDYRAELLKLRAEEEELAAKIQPAINSANEDVEALPPAPAQGQPSEPEQAASSRAEANAYLSYLTSMRASLEGAHNRINKLIGAILDIRRTRITNNLFQRMPGVFSPATWQAVPSQAREVAEKVRMAVTSWWGVQEQDQIIPLAGIAVALWLGLSVLGLAGLARLKRFDGEPPFWLRASTAAGEIVLKSLPAIVPLVFLYNAVDQVQTMPNHIGWLFYSGARSIIIIAVINALIGTALSPGDHRWRLIPASNWAALRISGLILTLAIVYGVTTFIVTAVFVMKGPDALKLAVSLAPYSVMALLVIAILQTPLKQEDVEGLPPIFWFRAIRVPVWLVAASIIATGLSGYLALSRFITQQLIVTGTILAIVYLMLLWADGVAQAIGDESSGTGSWLSKTARLDQTGRQRLAVPVGLLLKFAVLLAAVPLILNQWQFAWADILEWYRQLFFGFHIGSTQVSLGAMLASIVVFILGYFAARLFQQWLDKQILQPAGLSRGLRDSIRTGVGYVGVSAAALFALSYAGFNLSNLAIVAGAFSVGIGFGLQSVVNNFVSGLILLAERPIKVGDLVVVGGEEGYVRKISVRSTEIETFDRANVLIPNSYFISEKVKNWTLRNNTARLAIPAGVSSDSDPRKVKEILLHIAKSHQNVMPSPEPYVDFEDFGADGFTFKLYVYIYDVAASVNTRTDLHIAILEAYKTAGIAIPSQQTDVTMRDMDWLRDAVKLYLANASEGHSAGNGSHAHTAASRIE